MKQVYDLPQTGNLIFVSPDGKAENDGSSLDAPTTIENAIKKAGTGDAIILRGGTYRTGNLRFNQGITIQPYKDEQPIIKGTYVATEWKDLENGLWTTKWERLFPEKPEDWWRREREGKKTPLHRFNNDIVFIDGKFMQSAGWEGELDENSFFIDYEDSVVYIAVDPKDKLVEITAFNVGFHRIDGDIDGRPSDGKGPVIRGIVLTQFAYRAIEIEGTEPEGISPEANHGNKVVGTTLENCEISNCSRVAGYFRGNGLTIRNCNVFNTSTEGIYVIASNDVLLEKNIFSKNNIENITGYFPAAVKIFNQSYRVTCNDNLVKDLPNSNGIWYDVGNVDGVFTNNWLENVGKTDFEIRKDQLWPSDNAFFYEISKRAVVTGNVFVNCDHGMLILNSSDVKIYNNTFVNSMACIGRNERSAVGDHFGWHPATGPDVDERDGHIFVNNLLVGEKEYDRPVLFVWQRASLCNRLNLPQVTQLNYNTYVRNSGQSDVPLIIWGPVKNEKCQAELNNPSELKKITGLFSDRDKYFPGYTGPLFKDFDGKNYAVLKTFAGAYNARKLPPDVQSVAGFPKNLKPFSGAYPPVE